MAYDIELLRSIAMTEPDPAALEYRGKSRVVQPTAATLPTAAAESPSLQLQRWRHDHPPQESHSHARPSKAAVLGEADTDLGPQS